MTVPRFFFGAMSPYSWFAAERIEALLPGAAWQPVFAGALFKAHGRSSWGLDDRREAGLADCQARARRHGLGTILWPEPWPTNDVLVARAMTYASRRDLLAPFALAAMRMAFREGADLGDPVKVGEAGERVGIAAGELAAAVEDPAIKQALRSTDDHAVSLGVFGVPTVTVNGELFWGDDRLEAATSAWRASTSPPPSPV